MAERLKDQVAKRLERLEEKGTGEDEARIPELEMKLLNQMGLVQILKWIEQDKEAVSESKAREKQDRMLEGSRAHEVGTWALLEADASCRAGSGARIEREFACLQRAKRNLAVPANPSDLISREEKEQSARRKSSSRTHRSI